MTAVKYFHLLQLKTKVQLLPLIWCIIKLAVQAISGSIFYTKFKNLKRLNDFELK